MKTTKEILRELNERIETAKQDFEESKIALNSYGHGYDSGLYDGLVYLKKWIEGLDD